MSAAAAGSASQVVTTFPLEVTKWVHPGIYTTATTFDQVKAAREEYMDLGLASAKGGAIVDTVHKKICCLVYNKIFFSAAYPKGMPYNVLPFYADYVTHTLILGEAEKKLKEGYRLDTVEKLNELMKFFHKGLLTSFQEGVDNIGEFRTSPRAMLVGKTPEQINFSGTFQDFVRKYEPKSWTAELIAQGKRYNELVLKDVAFEDMTGVPKIMEILRKHNVICPPSKKIEPLMKQLFVEFSAVLKTGDAIAAACKLHQGIVRIHPFDDANGRVARLMMNFVLMQNGHQPVGFDSDAKYTAAVRQDDEDAKSNAFYKFVKPMVEQRDDAITIEKYMKIPGIAEHEALDSQVVAARYMKN